MREPQMSLLEDLVACIVRDSPMQSSSLRKALERLTAEERIDLATYVGHCADTGISLQRLSEAYRTISEDTLREQIYFRRHGKYRYSTFAEVADKVYFDDSYMSNYMYGLALTQFLWPNHLEIARFFRSSLERAPGGSYLEVGPGHGTYFRLAIRSEKFHSCLGVDISPTSLAQTRALLGGEPGNETPWELLESDFLAMAPLEKKFDAIVMGEVLEHVERPADFLAKIFQLTNDGAFVFITTAINAPAVDHIYLYRSVEDVTSMAERAGFRVDDVLATPYPGCTMAESVDQALPVNIALVLGK